MLLRQYVQEALAAKASGGSTKLYDQCVPPPPPPLPLPCRILQLCGHAARLLRLPLVMPTAIHMHDSLRPQAGERGEAAAGGTAGPRARRRRAAPTGGRPCWRGGAAGGAAARPGRVRQPGARAAARAAAQGAAGCAAVAGAAGAHVCTVLLLADAACGAACCFGWHVCCAHATALLHSGGLAAGLHCFGGRAAGVCAMPCCIAATATFGWSLQRARPPLLTPSAPPSTQALRLALLDWVCHVVVANGALVQSCLQTLVYSLLPPPGELGCPAGMWQRCLLLLMLAPSTWHAANHACLTAGLQARRCPTPTLARRGSRQRGRRRSRTRCWQPPRR